MAFPSPPTVSRAAILDQLRRRCEPLSKISPPNLWYEGAYKRTRRTGGNSCGEK